MLAEHAGRKTQICSRQSEVTILVVNCRPLLCARAQAMDILASRCAAGCDSSTLAAGARRLRVADMRCAIGFHELPGTACDVRVLSTGSRGPITHRGGLVTQRSTAFRFVHHRREPRTSVNDAPIRLWPHEAAPQECREFAAAVAPYQGQWHQSESRPHAHHAQPDTSPLAATLPPRSQAAPARRRQRPEPKGMRGR